MPLLSAGQTNIPVQDLLDHATKIRGQASKLETELDGTYSACIRPANFDGNAAKTYDEFMDKWKSSQAALLQNMRSAADVLQKLADVTQQNNELAASAMSI